MRQADWYFDFVSPYSYFGLLRLEELRDQLDIRVHPVLFAGLLEHWQQKGPAEIPGKRLWTYRSCAWYAARNGIPFRFPAAHPFNPLQYLRLAVAAGGTLSAVTAIFRELWTTGVDPTDESLIPKLARSLGVDLARLGDADVKQALRASTEQAATRGVFGVPTIIVDGELFWGADAMDFVKAYCADPSILQTDEMRRVATLRVGASRK
jgi:2-hydroxychromene-2-carboxylate isomerase